MNVIRARASYAATAKFTTWLYRIAHNRLIDHWRANGRAELVSADSADDDGDPLAAIPGSRNDEPEVRAEATRDRRALARRPRCAAACAARRLPAAPGRRPRARGNRGAHRRRRRDGEEPDSLRPRASCARSSGTCNDVTEAGRSSRRALRLGVARRLARGAVRRHSTLRFAPRRAAKSAPGRPTPQRRHLACPTQPGPSAGGGRSPRQQPSARSPSDCCS